MMLSFAFEIIASPNLHVRVHALMSFGACIAYRTILQSWIVYKKHYGVLLSPPIPSVDRNKLKMEEGEGGGENQQLQQSVAHPQAWRGPRTGSILRSIHGGQSV